MQARDLTMTALLAFACGGDAPPAEFTSGSTSSATDPTTTTVDPTAESSGGPTSSPTTTTATDPDSSGGAETSTTDPTDASSSEGSSGPACPPGELGCPCDRGACDSNALCVADLCEAAMNCAVDGYEPNDDEATATPLPELGDGDDPGSIAGELDHADDADWYTYAGIDNFGLPPGVAPLRDLAADGQLRLCKFLECPSGILDTEVTCPDGSDLAQSPAGRPGCCAAGSIAMPDFNCNGDTDDSAQVYIRLDHAVEQCVQYSVAYEY